MTKRESAERLESDLMRCLRICSFAGAATIVAESKMAPAEKRKLIRRYARLAIWFGCRIQARHIIIVRHNRLMTPAIRREYAAMKRR